MKTNRFPPCQLEEIAHTASYFGGFYHCKNRVPLVSSHLGLEPTGSAKTLSILSDLDELARL